MDWRFFENYGNDRMLKKLYPDFNWNVGYKEVEVHNCLLMDEVNVEKFKKLYVKEDRERKYFEDFHWDPLLFSLSMVIPEPFNESEEWKDDSKRVYEDALGGPFYEKIGQNLAVWRYENWGTPSEAVYDEEYETLPIFLLLSIEELSKYGFVFRTLFHPPLKIYEKMATDGLKFGVQWSSKVNGKWNSGEGVVAEGYFKYKAGIDLFSESFGYHILDYYLFLPFRNGYVRDVDRENLIRIIVMLRERIIHCLRKLLDGACFLNFHPEDLSYIGENVYKLNKPLDLNFLDVSRVTDMSELFENFDFSIQSGSEKYRFKIKLDISQWDVSNVTKMAHMFDGCDHVDFGDLSKWDRSKVTDC